MELFVSIGLIFKAKKTFGNFTLFFW